MKKILILVILAVTISLSTGVVSAGDINGSGAPCAANCGPANILSSIVVAVVQTAVAAVL